jgi:hypothetical protein
VALVFLLAGYVLCFIGGLWLVVLAWQKGILWGLGCIFLPVVQLIYIALNWKQTKSAFLLLLAGFAAFFVSALIGG